MVKLPLEAIKKWLDGMPTRREAIIEFRTIGVFIQLRQISATAHKAQWAFSWELLLDANIDMLQLKLLELMEKLDETTS